MSFQIRDSLFQRNSNCRKFRIFVEIFTKFRLFITIYGPHKFKFSPSKFFPSWKLYLWMKKRWYGSLNPTIRLNQTWLSHFLDCPVTNVTCVTACVTTVLFRLSARLVKLQKLHFLDRYTIPYIKLYTFQKSGMRVQSSWLLMTPADWNDSEHLLVRELKFDPIFDFGRAEKKSCSDVFFDGSEFRTASGDTASVVSSLILWNSKFSKNFQKSQNSHRSSHVDSIDYEIMWYVKIDG